MPKEEERNPKSLSKDLIALRKRWDELKGKEKDALEELKKIRAEKNEIADKRIWQVAEPTLFDGLDNDAE